MNMKCLEQDILNTLCAFHKRGMEITHQHLLKVIRVVKLHNVIRELFIMYLESVRKRSHSAICLKMIL